MRLPVVEHLRLCFLDLLASSVEPVGEFRLRKLPLAPQVELLQDVVEDLVQRQFDGWSAPPTCEVRQDKFIKLLRGQTRWNPLPVLAFRHFDCQSKRILPARAGFAQTQCSCGLADNFNFQKTRNQLQDSIGSRFQDRLRLRKTAASTGNILIAQRCTVE